jgi:hypothetical protein
VFSPERSLQWTQWIHRLAILTLSYSRGCGPVSGMPGEPSQEVSVDASQFANDEEDLTKRAIKVRLWGYAAGGSRKGELDRSAGSIGEK